MLMKNLKKITIPEGVVKVIRCNGQILWQAIREVLKTISGIPPLNLINSIGKDIDDYKIYGNSVQGLLPSEYQEVEYIESTGTQYINLGIKGDSNTEVDIIFSINTANSTNTGVFGSRGSNANSNIIAMGYVSTATVLDFNNSSYSTYRASTSETFTDVKLRGFINKTFRQLIRCDTNSEIINNIKECADNISTNELFLFAQNGVSAKMNGKIYKVAIKNKNISYVLIPCYRISDNVIGMYDVLNNHFYTNNGTGDFEKGANVVYVPSLDNPVEIESVGIKTSNLFNISKASGDSIVVNDDSTLTVSGYPAYTSKTLSEICPDLKEGDRFKFTFATDGVTNLYIGKTLARNTEYVITSDMLSKKIGFYRQSAAQGGGNATIERIRFWKTLGYPANNCPLEPYGYRIPIITKSINVFDESKMEYTTGATVNNHIISYAGSLNVDIKLPAGRYTLICDHNNTMWVRNGKVGSGYVVSKSKTTPYVTFNFSGTYDGYLRLSMFKPANENAMMSNIMIIEGSISAVPQYEPYIEPIITNIYLDEPLRKIGDYADYIDFKDKKEVHYNGSTPIEEPIDLPIISANEGTTVINVGTLAKPSNMVVDYYANT